MANALAVYLLNRYAVRRITPAIYKGGLPGNRLKRVLDYIAFYLDENMSLAQLAAIAGLSPHYFSELFKRSTGRAAHNYVLMRRIERAKQQLRDPKRSIIDAGLAAGFQNRVISPVYFENSRAPRLRHTEQSTWPGRSVK